MAGKSKSRKDKGSAAKSPPPSDTADAIALLEADHREVESLFAQIKEVPDKEKRALVLAVCTALKIHARLEEDLFYPAALAATGESGLLQEAQVEHASAKDLIAQIETGFPGEPLYDARLTVLAEYVRHHVGEEEEELFPRCRKAGMDVAALGEALLQRKRELALGLMVSNPIPALN